jgi:translation initiation factor 2 beta subunit (eIF-2beta)/eIF-5
MASNRGKKVKLINIRGKEENNDPFYRYKMEEVIICNQGAENVFQNINNICLALHRDYQELLKFLRKHFGSQFKYKNDMAYTTKNDLTQELLQSAIYVYIQDNVLCEQCGNPETEYVEEKKKTYRACKACSFKKES